MRAILEPPRTAPPPRAAKKAGLRYVRDGQPGIRRLAAGGGFRYVHPDGKPVKDEATLARVKRLAIPPAWADVWICPTEDGHLQATGRDARGRKQYRYHAAWRAARDASKFDQMLAFGEALPRMRRRVRKDLGRDGLPREKVLATIVRLLETTYLRVGNHEYRKANGSHGLTTLRDRHVSIRGSTMRLSFKGKSGKRHEVEVDDERLTRIVKKCQDLPGQELFRYKDEKGVVRSVDSADVNEYLREVSGGQPFTAKDFRTWAGTLLAANALRTQAPAATQAEGKRVVARAIEEVAKELRNTPAVCRKCYVHPAVLDAYLQGTFAKLAARATPRRDLRADEAALLALLR